MFRFLSGALGALMLVGCGDSNELDGVTAECILDPIVEELRLSGAVDCSPEPDPDGLPLPYYIAAEQTDDTQVLDCIRDALASRKDAIYLSELISGIDSLLRTAKFVNADGETRFLWYDSSPTGQGSGSNTMVLYECAPFSEDPSLGCEDERLVRLVCTQDERLRASFR